MVILLIRPERFFYDYLVRYRQQIFLSLYYSHKICVFNLNSVGLMVPEISKDGDITYKVGNGVFQ